jgi:hypothetical protein
MNAEEFLSEWLVDIPLRGLGGQKMSRTKIEEKLKKAAEVIENDLDIKLAKRTVLEEHDYEKELFAMWGYIKMNYLINEVKYLAGKFNSVEQIQFDNSWLSTKSKQDSAARNLHIVPLASGNVTFSGSGALFVFFKNLEYIPNYWHICYVTGFDRIPRDIMEVIGKMAAITVMAVMGDISFGAGLASTSLSIDGLSQSISTTQSAENSLYSARIRQYATEIEKFDIKRLRARYKSVNFGVL